MNIYNHIIYQYIYYINKIKIYEYIKKQYILMYYFYININIYFYIFYFY